MAPVPELQAKRARRAEAWAAEKSAAAADAKKAAKATRSLIFKKAAAYVNEYRQQVRAVARRRLLAWGIARRAESDQMNVLMPVIVCDGS